MKVPSGFHDMNIISSGIYDLTSEMSMKEQETS
jgi:hypothetical protein